MPNGDRSAKSAGAVTGGHGVAPPSQRSGRELSTVFGKLP